jgi:hypothetical protein
MVLSRTTPLKHKKAEARLATAKPRTQHNIFTHLSKMLSKHNVEDRDF